MEICCGLSWLQVEEQRKKDAAKGHEIAAKLEGKINRKVYTYMYILLGLHVH